MSRDLFLVARCFRERYCCLVPPSFPWTKSADTLVSDLFEGKRPRLPGAGNAPIAQMKVLAVQATQQFADGRDTRPGEVGLMLMDLHGQFLGRLSDAQLDQVRAKLRVLLERLRSITPEPVKELQYLNGDLDDWLQKDIQPLLNIPPQLNPVAPDKSPNLPKPICPDNNFWTRPRLLIASVVALVLIVEITTPLVNGDGPIKKLMKRKTQSNQTSALDQWCRDFDIARVDSDSEASARSKLAERLRIEFFPEAIASNPQAEKRSPVEDELQARLAQLYRHLHRGDASGDLLANDGLRSTLARMHKQTTTQNNYFDEVSQDYKTHRTILEAFTANGSRNAIVAFRKAVRLGQATAESADSLIKVLSDESPERELADLLKPVTKLNFRKKPDDDLPPTESEPLILLISDAVAAHHLKEWLENFFQSGVADDLPNSLEKIELPSNIEKQIKKTHRAEAEKFRDSTFRSFIDALRTIPDAGKKVRTGQSIK